MSTRTSRNDRVQIRIDLKSAGVSTFAALFRVAWSRDGDSWRVEKAPPALPPGRGTKPGPGSALSAQMLGR